MTLCHACGLEVAENEGFCPHCGVALGELAPEHVSDAEIVATETENSGESSAQVATSEAPETNLDSEPKPKGKSPKKGVIADEIAESSVEPLDTKESTALESPVAETTHVTGSDTDGKKPGLKPLSEGINLNGRYEIVRKIGGGGMGAVYLALDKNLGGVERAVKEMVQSSIEEEQQKKAIDDFKRESMILSTLDHPSIPTIYDYFFDDAEGRFYLVMKYISGGDLAAG